MPTEIIRKFSVIIASLAISWLFSGCLFIFELTHPSFVESGEQIVTTIKIEMDETGCGCPGGGPSGALVAVMIPVDWTVDKIEYHGDYGPAELTFLHPDSVDNQPGSGEDHWYVALEDAFGLPPEGYHWQVYQGEHEPWIGNDTSHVDVVIEMTPGVDGQYSEIAYFVSLTNFSINAEFPYWDIRWNNKISVGTTLGDLAVNPGWNFLGLPVDVLDSYYLSIFPNAIPGTLFGFDGSYFQTDTLEFGTGYWLNFSAAEVMQIEGFPVDSLTIDLMQGWNMISGVSYDIALDAVYDPGSIIMPGTLFGFNGAYVAEDTLKQGGGYWIRALAGGQISLDRNAGKQGLKVAYRRPNLEQFPTLTIRDAAGNFQTLYFAIDTTEIGPRTAEQFPPIPPASLFDARFANDLRATAATEAAIYIQTTHFPVTITASNLPAGDHNAYQLSEIAGNQALNTFALKEGNSVTIDDPDIRHLKLSKTGNFLPREFSVAQNYPNPFNPETKIRYAIPRRERVELVVFNALGQHVRTLLSGVQEAGFYIIRWDGKNSVGGQVASGVYYYRITTGINSTVRKMVLMQ